MKIDLSVPLSVGETECATANKISGAASLEQMISTISFDSRDICRGELFISLSGSAEAGLSHIREAESKGALTLFPSNYSTKYNGEKSLLALSEYYKQKLRCLRNTVAITGSVGKTTTKEILGTVCREAYRTHTSYGNHNNAVGLPISILSAPSETEILILEMGMNHRGEISLLSKCARPDIAIITTVGTSHIGNLGSREEICTAKLEVLDGMSTVNGIICELDEPLLATVPNRFTFSTGEKSDYSAYEESGCVWIRAYGERARTSFPRTDHHNLKNLAAAIGAAHRIGIDLQAIINGISRIDENHFRDRCTRIGDLEIIDDSYNASRESVIAALNSHKSRSAKIRSALLGDILEVGEHSANIHEEIGRAAAAVLDKLYITGEYRDYVYRGARAAGMPDGRIFILPSANNIGELKIALLCHAEHGESILIKASNKIGLSRLVEELRNNTADE